MPAELVHRCTSRSRSHQAGRSLHFLCRWHEGVRLGHPHIKRWVGVSNDQAPEALIVLLDQLRPH